MKILQYFLFGFCVLFAFSLVITIMSLPFYIWENYGMYYGIFAAVFYFSAIFGLFFFTGYK